VLVLTAMRGLRWGLAIVHIRHVNRGALAPGVTHFEAAAVLVAVEVALVFGVAKVLAVTTGAPAHPLMIFVGLFLVILNKL